MILWIDNMLKRRLEGHEFYINTLIREICDFPSSSAVHCEEHKLTKLALDFPTMAGTFAIRDLKKMELEAFQRMRGTYKKLISQSIKSILASHIPRR